MPEKDTWSINMLFKEYGLFAAWIMSLLATGGSLFFSEVMKLPPCTLCWYQRILMYPLAIIFTVGILRKDKKLYQYVLPFSVAGFLVALYHFLLYIGVIPESLAPCSYGVSCTDRLIEFFGFVDIPFMSMCAFFIISAIMIAYRNLYEK